MAFRTARTHSSNVSIVEVAALANVSTATVSRVLSGQRSKEDDIDRRVRKAARKLQYSANFAASALRSDVTNTLGVVVQSFTNPFTHEFITALEPIANARGLELLVAIGSTSEARGNRVKALLARKVDGLIVMTGDQPNLHEATIAAARQIPVVQVSVQPASTKINWVGVDASASMQLMLEHLAAHNATSVAFLGQPFDNATTAALYTSFQVSCQLMNMYTEPEWTKLGERSMQRGYYDTMTLFDSEPNRSTRPNALICVGSAVADGAVVALSQLGLRVPEDVNIMCVDAEGDDRISLPALTSVSPAYDRIAEEAMQMAGSKSTPRHIALPCRITQRESTNSPRFGASDMSEIDNDSQ
jgi:LacI family transcriptional regulator